MFKLPANRREGLGGLAWGSVAVPSGPERPPHGWPYGTAVSLLMLEVPYRHLPLYQTLETPTANR